MAEFPSIADSGSVFEWPPSASLRRAEDRVDLLELARLLDALETAPRVGSAAQALGMSYRSAWGKLVAAERFFGIELVERVTGHGSRPTAAGRSLARAAARFEREAQRRSEAPARALHEALAALASRPGTDGRSTMRDESLPALRVAASHDLLLQAVLSGGDAGRWNVGFVGSELALAALDRGDAELVGFHLPEPLPVPAQRPAVFSSALHFTTAVVRREQGLIVARGNPKRIHDVIDLARSGLRFVNRQRGAGTRAWFDRLLRERGLVASSIVGYEREEFTHLAVAASVAAGLADAGFGLRAAAEQLDLGFVPIGTERYFFAGARALREAPAVRLLIAQMRARADVTAGYARCRR